MLWPTQASRPSRKKQFRYLSLLEMPADDKLERHDGSAFFGQALQHSGYLNLADVKEVVYLAFESGGMEPGAMPPTSA